MVKKIINHAPLRDRPVVKEDFERIAVPLTCVEDTEDFIKNWEQFIPLLPDSAYDVLTKDLHGRPNVEIEFSDFADIKLYGKCFSNGGREVDFANKRAYSGYLTVDPNLKGQNIGAKILCREIEFMHACGIQGIDITAGDWNGAYITTRLGFLPEDYGEVLESIQKRLKFIYRFLEKPVRQKIHQQIDSNNPYRIWDIADDRMDVKPILKEIFNDPRHSQLLFAMESSMNPNSFKYGIKLPLEDDATPFPFGRFLLAGMVWDSKIDFENIHQMQRAGKYGEWKYLEIKND